MPRRLPPLIKLLVSRTPKIYQPAVSHAVFPALGAHLWKTTFRYIDNVDHEATLMNCLMGETGAGKNCISDPISFILKDIRLRDRENMEREKEWKKEMQTKGANKDKRCFVFVHSHIDDNVEGGVEDSGNPAFARENSIFGYWGATKTANFINLMKQYPNAILFHGHTHITFEAQEFDKDANYSEENGFKSVHVPSLGAPRTLISADGTWTAADSESQGYIVDVYADCIMLNGWDFVGNKPVPLGVYKIDTTT